MKTIEFVLHPDIADSVYDELEVLNIPYHSPEIFSATPIDQVLLLIESIPWEPIAGLLGAWLGRRSSRRVIISYPDNSKIDITGYSKKEIEQITSHHKQWSILFYDKSSLENKDNSQ